jgi:hypothetical protein
MRCESCLLAPGECEGGDGSDAMCAPMACAVKWKLAAEALSVTCGAMQVGCPGGDYCGKQASPELCAPCYLKQALDGTVNRGPNHA